MDDFWGSHALIERAWYRAHNTVGRVTLPLGDDSGGIQTHQIEGYAGELRDGMQRYQLFGLSSMPLRGAKGVAVYQSGHRGFATIVGDEDPRYRPKGQKPGELQLYMVDGAKDDGTGGTMRGVIKAALGWALSLFGKTIVIGDSNTQSVTIIGSSSIKLQGDVEITGKLTVDGTTTVQDIAINGNETGGGAA